MVRLLVVAPHVAGVGEGRSRLGGVALVEHGGPAGRREPAAIVELSAKQEPVLNTFLTRVPIPTGT